MSDALHPPEWHRELFDNSPTPILVIDARTLEFLAVNETAQRHYGYSRLEFLKLKFADLSEMREVPPQLATDATEWTGSARHRQKSGCIINVELAARAVSFAGRPARMLVVRDVTEQLRLQEQLQQSVKMDALGRLAGGVAHDFNNLLSVVLGYTALMLEDVPVDQPMHADLQEVVRAAERAAELTRQLLAFSRHNVTERRTLDVNGVVGGMSKMLRRILPEDIDLQMSAAAPGAAVDGDAGQIENILMNLAVNARDAMPTGGRLTIETSNVELDEEFTRSHFGAKPGPHVMIAVSDTGIGMDKQTRARIFEPFFTTKAQGKGTGLGLSTVFGIVQQYGGVIWVYSELGRGTTFKIFIPRAASAAIAAGEKHGARLTRGTETILLAEDEAQVRAVAAGILRRGGYRVVEAASPTEALVLCQEHPGAIDLLVTDLVMPQMNGNELAARLRTLRPGLKVLYMSGYTEIVMGPHLAADSLFLQKPFTPDGLTSKVRALLDATPTAPNLRATA